MWSHITVAAFCITCVLCQTNTAKQSLTIKTTTSKSGCNPPCKVPFETCVTLSRCKGETCNMCAETPSIKLPGVSAAQTLQNQQLKMLMQMQALRAAKNNANAAVTASTSGFDTVTPNTDSGFFFGNSQSSSRSGSGSNQGSMSVSDFLASSYLLDYGGFGLGFF